MKTQAPQRNVTGGVDTHLDFHVVAVLDSQTARLLDTASFPANSDGYVEMLAWLASFGTIDAVGVESTGSYGAGLSRHLTAESTQVIEVNRPDRSERRFNGKSDTIDAEAAARAVISGKATTIPKSQQGPIEAIRALEIVHHSAVKDRTRAINQFKAILITAPAELRERLEAETFRRQLELARRFNNSHPCPTEREVRFGLKILARRIGFLTEQSDELTTRIRDLTSQTNPALAGLSGVGPHVAAQLLAAAGDNPERLHSEPAFAKLCGACPVPTGSGKTSGRHKLNRGGDRRANRALFTVVLVRMRYDPRTRAYVERRTNQGKSRKEIMRCLKRFVAREVYHVIVNPPPVITGSEVRELRSRLEISLTDLSVAMQRPATAISRLERGLEHNTALATQAHQWLQKTG